MKILKIIHGVRRVLRSYRLRTITGKSYRLNFQHIGGYIEGVKYVIPLIKLKLNRYPLGKLVVVPALTVAIPLHIHVVAAQLF